LLNAYGAEGKMTMTASATIRKVIKRFIFHSSLQKFVVGNLKLKRLYEIYYIPLYPKMPEINSFTGKILKILCFIWCYRVQKNKKPSAGDGFR